METSWTRLWKSKWLVLVTAMWLQACAGVGYVFGSYSPAIKSALHYNQKQINTLGVAKDIGDSVGLLAGTLSDVLPPWGQLLLGACQNLLGYGWLWLIVKAKVAPLPFWAICVLICISANGETYFNTAALVSCVRNFPRNRGPIVGILKAFAGLSGAIFSQIYCAFFRPDQAAFIFIVAVGPAMVAVAVMFIIRPIHGLHEEDGSESTNFKFIYSVCLVLAAYLMGVMLLQDLAPLNDQSNIIFAAGLLFLLVLPLAAPIAPFFVHRHTEDVHSPAASGGVTVEKLKVPLLDVKEEGIIPSALGKGVAEPDTEIPRAQDMQKRLIESQSETALSSESEDERPKEIISLPEPIRKRRLARWRSGLFRAIAAGAVRVKRRRGEGPRRGEDFTLRQALIKADFWLLFFALYCGAGSGLTVIDNLGQIAQAQGYADAHIFVSMISIWNFLGRLAGGCTSEIVARDHAIPRPLTMAVAQIVMAAGHFLLATACPGSLYAGSLLVGLGYGAHWSIVPATASELFGLKNFGILYNFLTIANPAGSMLFSGLIAGSLYDWEAQKQRERGGVGLLLAPQQSNYFVNDNNYLRHNSSTISATATPQCQGKACFFLTFLVLTTVCLVGVALSSILVFRTRRVYLMLYDKAPHPPEPPTSSSCSSTTTTTS